MEPTSPVASNTAPMSVKDWFITLFISSIPFVGFIMLFVWAFGSETTTNKQNWAKAALLLAAIIFVITIMMYILFVVVIGVAMWGNNQT